MKNILLVVGTAPMFATTFAEAAHWPAVSPVTDETVFKDSDSIRTDGAHTKAWVLRNYSRVKTLGDNGFPHKSELIVYAFRCEAGDAGYAQWRFHSGELASGRTAWADKVGRIGMIAASTDPALTRALGRVCNS